MPIIPEVNDHEAHFRTLASLVRHAKKLIRVEILPYQRAAGAKYEMVGRVYHPEFDETKPLKLFTQVFSEEGIPFILFR